MGGWSLCTRVFPWGWGLGTWEGGVCTQESFPGGGVCTQESFPGGGSGHKSLSLGDLHFNVRLAATYIARVTM